MGRRRTWTDQQLRDAVKASHTLTETLKRLGLRGRGHVSLHIDRLNLSTKHWDPRSLSRRGSPRSWTDTQLKEVVSDATSLTDVLRLLGLSHENSYSRKLVRMQIGKLDLDCTHFVDWSHLKGKPLKKLLRKNTHVHTSHLKSRLIRHGLIEKKCQLCGNPGEWLGQPLTLDMDHVNGDRTDNRLKNLRLLCPNCHSQTLTYKGKKRHDKRINPESGQPAADNTSVSGHPRSGADV